MLPLPTKLVQATEFTEKDSMFVKLIVSLLLSVKEYVESLKEGLNRTVPLTRMEDRLIKIAGPKEETLLAQTRKAIRPERSMIFTRKHKDNT